MTLAAELDPPVTERRSRTERRRSVSPELAAALEQAIGRGDIDVLFQPQFLCTDGSLSGAEALVRWNRAGMEPMAGDRVFALAQQAGLARRLSRTLCVSAMGAAAGWPRQVRLSINASAADLADPDYPAMLVECLGQAGLPASRLTLEITEQALVDRLDEAARTLSALTDRGIAIALDDFGAGFCNFRYLKALPLAALKLDRSMIEGIATDRRDLAVFRAIMAMARALDLLVIAEGVETEAQRAAVCREGCDRWQGFLGAAPMPAEEFASLAAR